MERGVGGRFDLSDAEWGRLEGLIPVPSQGRRSRDLRRQLNGIMWRFRTGSPWRDVPERYGKWDTVYNRFRSWRNSGVWQVLLEAVLADAQADGRVGWQAISVDSTTNRAHQHAAGAVFTEVTLESFEASEAAGQKGATETDEPLLAGTELAIGLEAAIRELTEAPIRPIRSRRRVVRYGAAARPASPPPTSAAPGEG